jgi:hypothetical protein
MRVHFYLFYFAPETLINAMLSYEEWYIANLNESYEWYFPTRAPFGLQLLSILHQLEPLSASVLRSTGLPTLWSPLDLPLPSREADHLPPSIPEVTHTWGLPSTPSKSVHIVIRHATVLLLLQTHQNFVSPLLLPISKSGSWNPATTVSRLLHASLSQCTYKQLRTAREANQNLY